jgi:hypothetical protein
MYERAFSVRYKMLKNSVKFRAHQSGIFDLHGAAKIGEFFFQTR